MSNFKLYEFRASLSWENKLLSTLFCSLLFLPNLDLICMQFIINELIINSGRIDYAVSQRDPPVVGV